MSANGQTPGAGEAMSELCSAYYAPVVAFLRVQVGDEDKARDLAHAFFARLLEKKSLAGIDPGRGRFRSYLLGAVKHFVWDLKARDQAARRGRQHEHVSLEPGTDTSPGVDPPDPAGGQMELEFDRQWAFTLLESALGRLEAEQKAAGNERQFELLKPWLSGGANESQAEVSSRLGMNAGAVKVAIHRLRKRFREVIRQSIARTVESREAIQEEMDYLLEVLSAGS